MSTDQLSVKLNLPSMPEGADVEIPGLGVFKNGTQTPLTTEQLEMFEHHHGRMVDTASAEDQAKGLAAVVYQRGPTLKEAFVDHPYIYVVEEEPKPKEVEKAKDSKKTLAKKESSLAKDNSGED